MDVPLTLLARDPTMLESVAENKKSEQIVNIFTQCSRALLKIKMMMKVPTMLESVAENKKVNKL